MKFQHEKNYKICLIDSEILARILIDLCNETDGPILRTMFYWLFRNIVKPLPSKVVYAFALETEKGSFLICL